MKNIAFPLFLLLFLSLSSSIVLAVPHEINYQGVLKDSSGALVSGEVDMTFNIYDGTGTSLWNETQSGVTVEAGLYNVRLGSENAITPEVFNGDTRYLEVTVNNQTLSPRIPLISVPYALRAEELGGLSAEAFVKLGPGSFQSTPNKFGVMVQSTDANGIGLYGYSLSGIGVAGDSTMGKGVAGQSSSGPGVYGESYINYGVHGSSEAGTGVYGEGGNVGVYGKAPSGGYAGYFKGPVYISSNALILEIDKTPLSSSDGGSKGWIAWDANYLYIYTGTSEGWKRAPLSTF